MTDLLPSTPLKPVVAAMSTPPPINWATKPRLKASTTNEHSSVQLTNSSTPRRLIPIYIDPDHIGELQEAILRQSLTNQTVPTFGHHEEKGIESPPSQPPIADDEELANFDGPSLHTSSSADDSLDSMISSLSNLTVSSPPSPQVSSSLTKKRYYVITVGKCAGVFYNEWSVNLSSDRSSLIIIFLSRDYVSHLVLGVSGARYKGFPTLEKANQAYRHAKNNDKIRIVRDPDDDDKYGPLFYAVQ